MAEECVVAVYADAAQAKTAIERLVVSGFPQQNISLVTRSLRDEPTIVKQTLELGDEAEHDAVIGAGIGAVIGALGGGSVVVAMGMGVLIAGPLAASTGVVVGALIGGIAGWSVHKNHLEKYEAMAKVGKVLVIAHGSDPLKVAEAEVALQRTHPEELHLHAKVDGADDRRVDDL
jgi:hypothetical protein